MAKRNGTDICSALEARYGWLGLGPRSVKFSKQLTHSEVVLENSKNTKTAVYKIVYSLCAPLLPHLRSEETASVPRTREDLRHSSTPIMVGQVRTTYCGVAHLRLAPRRWTYYAAAASPFARPDDGHSPPQCPPGLSVLVVRHDCVMYHVSCLTAAQASVAIDRRVSSAIPGPRSVSSLHLRDVGWRQSLRNTLMSSSGAWRK